MTTALEHDILAELRERDLEVHQLRRQLKACGRPASHEAVYERLVHLEATDQARVLVLGDKQPVRVWGAL